MELVLQRCVKDFLKQFLTEQQALSEANRRIQGVPTCDIEEMWQQLIGEFCPVAPTPPDRSGKRVLAIGPGFGFLKNPEQIRIVERAGFEVCRLLAANPELSGTSMEREMKNILTTIDSCRHMPSCVRPREGHTWYSSGS